MPERYLPDIDELAGEMSSIIKGEAAQHMPKPVEAEVIDGSPQLLLGWVFGRRAGHTIQIRTTQPYDFRAATPTSPMNVLVLPPNPNEPNAPYELYGFISGGPENNRVPRLLANQVATPGGNTIGSTDDALVYFALFL